MESERRKVYVEVNVTHRPDGTARPKSEEPVSATRYRFAASPHFCSTKKTESGL